MRDRPCRAAAPAAGLRSLPSFYGKITNSPVRAAPSASRPGHAEFRRVEQERHRVARQAVAGAALVAAGTAACRGGTAASARPCRTCAADTSGWIGPEVPAVALAFMLLEVQPAVADVVRLDDRVCGSASGGRRTAPCDRIGSSGKTSRSRRTCAASWRMRSCSAASDSRRNSRSRPGRLELDAGSPGPPRPAVARRLPGPAALRQHRGSAGQAVGRGAGRGWATGSAGDAGAPGLGLVLAGGSARQTVRNVADRAFARPTGGGRAGGGAAGRQARRRRTSSRPGRGRG